MGTKMFIESNKLPRELVQSPTLEVFKTQLNKAKWDLRLSSRLDHSFPIWIILWVCDYFYGFVTCSASAESGDEGHDLASGLALDYWPSALITGKMCKRSSPPPPPLVVQLRNGMNSMKCKWMKAPAVFPGSATCLPHPSFLLPDSSSP